VRRQRNAARAHGAVHRPQRGIVGAALAERDRLVAHRKCVPGCEREARIARGERRRELSRLEQQTGQIAMPLGRARRARDRRAHAAHGVVEAAQVALRNGEVVAGVVVPGHERERTLEGVRRVLVAAQRAQRDAQVRVVVGVVGLRAYRRGEQLLGAREVLALDRAHPQQVQRIGVIRLHREHLLVERLGARQIARAVMAQRLLQHRTRVQWLNSRLRSRSDLRRRDSAPCRRSPRAP
jgi:hypothetical protein